MNTFDFKYDKKELKKYLLIIYFIFIILICYDFYFGLAVTFLSTITIYVCILFARECKVVVFEDYIEVTFSSNKLMKEKKYIVNKSDIKNIVIFKNGYIIKQNKINVNIPCGDNKEFDLYMKDLISELSVSNPEFCKNRDKTKKHSIICFGVSIISMILALSLLFFENIEIQLWCAPILIIGHLFLLIYLINIIKKE